LRQQEILHLLHAVGIGVAEVLVEEQKRQVDHFFWRFEGADQARKLSRGGEIVARRSSFFTGGLIFSWLSDGAFGRVAIMKHVTFRRILLRYSMASVESHPLQVMDGPSSRFPDWAPKNTNPKISGNSPSDTTNIRTRSPHHQDHPNGPLMICPCGLFLPERGAWLPLPDAANIFCLHFNQTID
jgi:hypothetical protein